MDPVEERLYGLLEVIEQQQVAVQRALEGLQTERAAIVQERMALAGEVRRLTPLLRREVEAAVTAGMVGMGDRGTQALQDAVSPLLSAVARATTQAGKAEKSLETLAGQASRRVTLSWFAWVAVLVVVSWAVNQGLFWYDEQGIEHQRATRTELTDEIARMQANRDAWEKAGMLEKLDRCGPNNRFCVRVDESAGHFGDQGDYRIIRGY